MTRKKMLGVPAGLGDSGAAFWSEIAGKYTLRADEMRTLEAACRALDMISDVRAAWDAEGRPYMAKGSMGQAVEHPMIGTMDKLQKSFEVFVKRLALPDDDAGGEQVSQQRAAAQSRWASAHGASA